MATIQTSSRRKRARRIAGGGGEPCAGMCFREVERDRGAFGHHLPVRQHEHRDLPERVEREDAVPIGAGGVEPLDRDEIKGRRRGDEHDLGKGGAPAGQAVERGAIVAHARDGAIGADGGQGVG
ncbi:hypothetical protein QYC26_14680 [Sphingomonas sp. C3-2]|nr:hypothetical protein [Sphingomonas sp. C3-2]WOK36232.1 hypothetical protein QYC26_14680 [Sphingomonas sp. C3-2]